MCKTTVVFGGINASFCISVLDRRTHLTRGLRLREKYTQKYIQNNFYHCQTCLCGFICSTSPVITQGQGRSWYFICESVKNCYSLDLGALRTRRGFFQSNDISEYRFLESSEHTSLNCVFHDVPCLVTSKCR